MGAQKDRADELGAVVNGHPENIPAVLAELEAVLRDPDDHHALAAAIIALGHAWDARAARLLVILVDPAHPEEEVRLALAQALPGGSDTEPVRSAAIATLTRLSNDEAGEVRDWACFGLGQCNADGHDVQDALAARLHDDHVNTRGEALLALAKTGDPRAITATVERLMDADPEGIRVLELEAAAELANPVLLPVLHRLGSIWFGDSDAHTSALGYATLRCQPGQLDRATKEEREFVAAVNQGLADQGSQRSIAIAGHYPRTTLTLTKPDGTTDHTFGAYRIWEDLTPTGDLGVESWINTIIEHDPQ